jgi:hypothetical protein
MASGQTAIAGVRFVEHSVRVLEALMPAGDRFDMVVIGSGPGGIGKDASGAPGRPSSPARLRFR